MRHGDMLAPPGPRVANRTPGLRVVRDVEARTFGEVLKHERLAACLTQEELAERASLSARAISDLERGVKHTPRRQTIELLAAALRLSAVGRTALAAAARSRRDPAASIGVPKPAEPLVGRAPELARLEAKLAEAGAGHGGIVVLTGEPGIGKTRLAERFAAQAREGTALVLWGQCYEGEVSPPYGPWAEVLSSYASTAGAGRLRELLGAGAPPLARLVPQVRAALPETPAAAPLSPDEERFRLHDAVAQFFLAIAHEQPVVLVLDDLHWADRDSLRLLRHIARFANRTRLLLVGTYRDVEVDRRDPLAETLAILQHETDYAHLPLEGWSFDETAAYLSGLAVEPLPQAFVRYIHQEAGGSPFYTRELFRHLVEEHSIVHREGRWSTDTDLRAAGIPQGVREVVGMRVARLSESTQRLLRHGAAFTGGFAFGLLPALTDLDEATLLDCLDEALEAGLIRAAAGQGETYAFAHAIVRHTLYDELSPSRRARLHRRIAETLEAQQPASGDQADAEIAAQYHASASLPGAERGVVYALRAAARARARYAPEQVVGLLRLARDLVRQSGPAARADVLQRLAVAEAEAVLLDDAPRTVQAAIEALDVAAGEPETVAIFLESVALLLKQGGAPPATWEPLVVRGLALLGEQRDLVWARLSLLQDRYVGVAHGSINAARWLGHDRDAIALVRSIGDEDDYARSLDPLTWREPAETEEALARVRTWSRPTAVLRGLNVVARDLFYRHGDFRTAVERYEEYLTAATRYGSVPDQAEALAQLACLLATLGQFMEARQTLARAHELVGRLGPGHRLHFVTMISVPMILAYYTTGDWTALVERIQRYMAGPEVLRGPLGLTAAACAALAYLRTGNSEESRRVLEALVPAVAQFEPRFYMQNYVVGIAGAVVWELEARPLASLFLRLAADLANARVAPGSTGAHEFTAAHMAALAGDWPAAHAWFSRARVVEDACGQRAVRALIDLDEARVLLSRGAAHDRQAQMLLQSAMDRFQALGMESWFERAAALVQQPLTSMPIEHPDGLTGREMEVLQLVASGLTSKEIAERLIISVATVQRHIANVYAKIDARGRADATAYAARHGLVRL